jgi:nitrogen regulatory protein P-II 1
MIFFKQYQKRIEMKRIEATIQATKITAVTEALNDIVGGFTILEGKGRGSGIRQQIRSGRGTGSITAEYNEVATVSTIANDSDVEKISTAIADAAFTGKGGDGIVVVTNVDNVLNIASKKSGSEAL